MHNTGLILDAESINDLKTLSIKAENVGFHSVWATELYRTSFQQIASTAQNTTKIRLGTAVSLAFTQSPLITALNSLDIDNIIECVPDKMVDLFAIVGDKKYCLEKIEHYRKLIDLPILSVPYYFIDYKDVQQYQLRLIELFSQ